MTPTLLLRLLPEGAAEWLALGRDGRVLAGPQAGWPSERAERVWVLVPGEDVLLLRAPRVARQRRQLEQAVPFAIEEQLVAPVEQQHVALSEPGGGAELGVAVVTQARMEAWLAQLREHGLDPDRMLADVELLPWEPGVATVLVEGPRALVRWSESGACAGDVQELPGWLALPGVAESRRVRWLGPADAAPEGLALRCEERGATLRWFATQLPSARPIELLQGRHAPRRGAESARSTWRWAAMLAAAALLAALGHLLLERSQLERRHAAQRIEMEQLLRRAVPGVTRVVDPRAQLAAEVARRGSGGGSGGALPLLARIAPSIAGSGRFTIDGLEFRGDTLELVVRGPDVATLDSLREALAALALQVELTSANPGAGGVEGRLRIRSGGA